MSWRERTLLFLTIVGFVVPHVIGLALIPFVIDHGFGSVFITYFMQTPPAAQQAADLIISFVTFALWALWEGRRLGMRAWWLPIPAALLVGLCFAVPLFLLLRERALRPDSRLSRASHRSHHFSSKFPWPADRGAHEWRGGHP